MRPIHLRHVVYAKWCEDRDLLSVLQCETETYASYSRREHENMFYYITYCLYRGITALP